MHEINKIGSGPTELAETATNDASKRNKSSLAPRDRDIDQVLGYESVLSDTEHPPAKSTSAINFNSISTG